MPKGGPDGGDGGRGGDVLLRCDDNLRDLQSFRRRPDFRAGRGGHGQGAQRHGADGEPLVIAVPPGTQVERWDGTRYDLVRSGQEVTLAHGGIGGRGNTRFKSSVRQAPRLAERGLPGEEGAVELHLKLLADIGLVGMPNAGKSSLLARSRARSRRSPTTRSRRSSPCSGRSSRRPPAGRGRHPGAYRGRERGAGLGHDFLAHVERTRLLVHLLDLSPLDGSDPGSRPRDGRGELARTIAGWPGCRGSSRCPRPTSSHPRRSSERGPRWRERLGEDVPVFVTSSATRQGLDVLARELLGACRPRSRSR